MARVAQQAAVLVLLIASIFCRISGSIIDFKGSSSSIKPLVTANFTLRCALNDTSPSPGSPGAVVGKRSVTSLTHVITEHDVMEAHRNKKDSASLLTSTAENVMLITSIIVSRDGKDLATLIDHFTAKPVRGTSGFTVTGQLTPGDSEKGFLELVWPHPTPQDAGNFQCDVATISAGGHVIEFSKTLAVAEQEVSIVDLVGQLSAQQTVIDGLTLANAGMKTSIEELKQINATMVSTVNGLKLANVDLKQGNVVMNRTIDDLIQIIANMNRTDAVISDEVLQLKSAKVPNVFFTVTYSSSSSYNISDKQVVVYDDIIVNEGGAYSLSTGIFTSPVTGFYYFVLSAVTYSDHQFQLQLLKNGNFVVEACTQDSDSDYNYNAATNSAIIHLAKGDTVKVVSSGTSFLTGRESYNKWNTFTGQLIARD